MSDAADKAHEDKVKATAGGEHLVPHAAHTDADRALREASDKAEVERVKAFQDSGYIAAPGVGDYNAARRGAKLVGAAMNSVNGEVQDDPSALVVDQVTEAAKNSREEAAEARRGAEQNRGAAPRGRRPASPATQAGSGSGDGK